MKQRKRYSSTRKGRRSRPGRVMSIAAGLVLAGAGLTVLASPDPVQAAPVTVFKNPACGCCTKWVTYLERHGFETKVVNTTDLAGVHAQKGVPHELGSCHTAVVDGYVVEGHVPAAEIERLLAERPPVAGLAVPGMPAGSPGMEGLLQQRYDVLAFTRDGGTSVFSRR